jgi:O-acetylhomoserine/O-acetylserine sulfhydrylase-like pyridoxal-dependent enzyme
MNQKEEFVKTLIAFTREERLKWIITNASKVSRYIINSDQVSQIFFSKLKGNEIYFLVQKYLKYDHEIDIHIEHFTNFVNILSGDNLVYSIYEYEVSENMLDELLDEIRSSLESNFFNKFMEEIN